MKCEDFRRCNSKGVDGIIALTRGERSACAQHWSECYECRDWSNTFVFVMTGKQVEDVELTKAKDSQDPEVYKLPPSEAERFDLDEKRKYNERQVHD